jgi:hypothetical protein
MDIWLAQRRRRQCRGLRARRGLTCGAIAAIWNSLGTPKGGGWVRPDVPELPETKGAICVSTVSIVGGYWPNRIPAGRIRAIPAVADVTGGSRWGSVADAADGADGTCPSCTYSDHPAPGPAFPTERNLDAQAPQERLRATQATSERAGICGPTDTARGMPLMLRSAPARRRSAALPVQELRSATISRTQAATGEGSCGGFARCQ